MPAQARPCPQAHSLQPGSLCRHAPQPPLTSLPRSYTMRGYEYQGLPLCGSSQLDCKACKGPVLASEDTAGYSLLLAFWGLGPLITQSLQQVRRTMSTLQLAPGASATHPEGALHGVPVMRKNARHCPADGQRSWPCRWAGRACGKVQMHVGVTSGRRANCTVNPQAGVCTWAARCALALELLFAFAWPSMGSSTSSSSSSCMYRETACHRQKMSIRKLVQPRHRPGSSFSRFCMHQSLTLRTQTSM